MARQLPMDDHRLSRLSIPVSSPNVRKTPKIVPPPNSPTKSVAGTILDNSHSPAALTKGTILKESSRPRLPELDRNPPLRHPQHRYYPQVELLPEEKSGRTHSLDFFDISDSSERDDRHNYEDKGDLGVPAQNSHIGMTFPEDVNLGDTMGSGHTTHSTLESTYDNSGTPFGEYVPYTEIANSPDNSEQNERSPLIEKFEIPQSKTSPFPHETLSRPMSQNIFMPSMASEQSPWTGPVSLPSGSRQSLSNFPETDRILSMYNMTLQTLLAHERTKRSQQLDDQLFSQLPESSVATNTRPMSGRNDNLDFSLLEVDSEPQLSATINTAGVNEHLNDDVRRSLHSNIQALYQLPPAQVASIPHQATQARGHENAQRQDTNDARPDDTSRRLEEPLSNDTGRFATSPTATSKKSVTILPPPLRSLPSPSTFSAPEMSTPYPFLAPTSATLQNPSPSVSPAHDTQATDLNTLTKSNTNANTKRRASSLIPPSPAFTRYIPMPSKLRPNFTTPLSPNLPSPSLPTSPLALSVRRKYALYGLQTIHLRINPAVAGTTAPAPALNSHPIVNNRRLSKHDIHFATLDFDDAALFRAIREQYFGALLGRNLGARFWRRWLSARELKRIRVVGAECCTLTEGGVAGLEERLYGRFCSPKKGKGRYAWIHFLQRIAGMAPGYGVHGYGFGGGNGGGNGGGSGRTSPNVGQPNTPSTLGPVNTPLHHRGYHDGMDERGKGDDGVPVGLEFVEGWSVGRIAFAVGLVLAAVMAAVLLWVFLGPGGAGRVGRVGTAFVIGIVVLIGGLFVILSWLGLSWIAM